MVKVYTQINPPKPQFEDNDGVKSPRYELTETRVSELYRRFAVGALNDLPRTSAQELPPDGDSSLLDDDAPFAYPDKMSDELDVMDYVRKSKDRYDLAEKRLRARVKSENVRADSKKNE